MDVTSFYTNIPQEEGIQTECEAYDAFYKDTGLLAQAFRLILQENSSQFCGKITYKLHMEPLWALKWWSHLRQIFTGKVETKILSQSTFKPLVWKRHIHSTTSGDTNREVLIQFIDQASNDHPTIKFTAEISETETTFLDTSVYKGQRFIYESVLDIRTYYKPTETCPEYTHFPSCHPCTRS